MKQAYNPYLPLYEYVPDGEPHVFDGRVYIYGSHDFADGEKYCMGDYVSWSAPVHDPGNWRYEGIIYRRTQDLPLKTTSWSFGHRTLQRLPTEGTISTTAMPFILKSV